MPEQTEITEAEAAQVASAFDMAKLEALEPVRAMLADLSAGEA